MEENESKKSNFIRYMANPRSFTLKKWFAELLKAEYMQHDEIIDRIASSLTTEKDLEQFGKLVSNIYEMAYKKAVEDYVKEAEKLGVKVSIVSNDIKKSQD